MSKAGSSASAAKSVSAARTGPARRVRRVLMTADAVGGVWTYALELAGALRARGVETTLAVMGPAPSAAQRRDAARIAELHEGAFALEWTRDPWHDVERAGEWLLALERSVAPDVVHVNGFAHCALPWAAPVLMTAHSCVCSWWRACRGEAAPAEWDAYRAAVRAGIAAADAIVAPTRAMLDAFHHEHDPARSHASRARVIPNASSPARHTTTREKVPLVLSAGRLWDEAKNVAALDALALGLPWPVVIAGSDVDHEGRRSSFAGSVSLGALTQSELAEWMSRAAIYALPARYEPFGLSALEAALSGCALVLGDIPSLRELWDGAAIFVDPDHPDALREALLALIGDASLCASYGRRALVRAREHADIARFGAAYADLYAALVTAHLGRTACA